jgi:hypothetical protein
LPKKRFSAEQIVMLLRQIEVSMAQATPTGFAGHAHPSAKANVKLTFDPDHSVGADHCSPSRQASLDRLWLFRNERSVKWQARKLKHSLGSPIRR